MRTLLTVIVNGLLWGLFCAVVLGTVWVLAYLAALCVDAVRGSNLAERVRERARRGRQPETQPETPTQPPEPGWEQA